jgi:uncharacterized membrane protein (UPF0127 family)
MLHIEQMMLAHTWPQRLRGLLGRPALTDKQALWLKPCHAVHTIGMRYPIAVHFLDHQGQVIRSIARLAPWDLAICLRANSVIEMASVDSTALSGQIHAIQWYMKTEFFKKSPC